MRKIFSPSKKNIFKASVLGLSLTFCNVNPTVVFSEELKQALAFAYQNNPDLLAAGISQALITTAFGLLIAVPGLVLHKYFEQKIKYLLINLQKEVSGFIDVINK